MAEDTDNTDKMMAQFIEKASPKLLAAMTDQITKLVEGQIGGLVKNSTKMLDELQDAKRAAAEAAAAEEQVAAKDDATKAALDTFSNSGPVQMTRADARNPKLYAAAKKRAADNGVTLQILSNEPAKVE